MQFKPRKQHIYNSLNKYGRDFIVGDLHGQIEALFEQLSVVNFNFKTDRLFCTGDLISRGKDSIACLNLLTEKWFYPVMGNHEQLFLLGFRSAKYWDVLKDHGGQWLTDNLHRFDLLMRWKTLIEICMPLTRTIDIPGFKVGVSHASSISNWSKSQEGILSNDEVWKTLWDRPLRDECACVKINAVDYVVHGHTPVKVIKKINNRYWIDTYSSNNKLTILNLNELNTS